MKDNRVLETEQKNKRFFKKVAGTYDKGLLGKILSRRVDKVLSLARVKPQSKILDVGCGTGTLVSSLSKDKTLEVYGIDLSKEMLEEARKKSNNKVHLQLGSVSNILDYYDEHSFDYIFVDDAFHHLPNQKEVIRDLKILLKDKGKLVISDISFGKLGNKLFHKIEPGNTMTHTAQDYVRMFKENGFKRIKQRKIGIVSIYTEGETWKD